MDVLIAIGVALVLAAILFIKFNNTGVPGTPMNAGYFLQGNKTYKQLLSVALIIIVIGLIAVLVYEYMYINH